MSESVAPGKPGLYLLRFQFWYRDLGTELWESALNGGIFVGNFLVTFFLFLFLFLFLSRGVVMEVRRREQWGEIGGNPSCSASNSALGPSNTCANSGHCHANPVL